MTRRNRTHWIAHTPQPARPDPRDQLASAALGKETK